MSRHLRIPPAVHAIGLITLMVVLPFIVFMAVVLFAGFFHSR
jgi:hypothetical protein